MRVIVHAGLHKTGSTYLQHLLNDHHERLRDAGFYYAPQPGYPAHHEVAWALLRGDPNPFVAMIEAAHDAACHTMIFSSEDLEGLIFNRSLAALLEDAAAMAGARSLEWHFCLRDPGDYFASLHSQLQYHVYSDSVALLSETLRDGMVMMIDPGAGEGTPFWCYCFDPMRYIGAFARATPHPVILHDFRDQAPCPGWTILEATGVLKLVTHWPGTEARNARLPEEDVWHRYCEQVRKTVGSGPAADRLMAHVEAHVRSSLACVADGAAVVRERFKDSMEQALLTYGYVAPACRQGLPPMISRAEPMAPAAWCAS